MEPPPARCTAKLLDQVRDTIRYKYVLDMHIDAKTNAVRAKRPQYVPAVLIKEEAHTVMAC